MATNSFSDFHVVISWLLHLMKLKQGNKLELFNYTVKKILLV